MKLLKTPKLSREPARVDLTDRECSKLIGSTVGGLMQMATIENVRRAVQWWASLSDEQWLTVYHAATNLAQERVAWEKHTADFPPEGK